MIAHASSAEHHDPEVSRAATFSTQVRQFLHCFFYGFCITASLLVYGLYQEGIMSHAYGGSEYFTVSVFLVLFNRVFGALFALVMIFAVGEPLSCVAPWWKCVLIAVCTVVASVCLYEALKYVSFTMQILGKSFKMMPVMMWGVLMHEKQYRPLDWLVAAGVTFGVMWFVLSGSIAPEHPRGSTYYGIGLLSAFVMLDGFTSSFQEKLFQDNRVSKYNQMLYINVASGILSLLMMLTLGQLETAFGFCNRHPEVYRDASVLSAAAVVAQWFVYSQVQEFGALAFAATMNVRQVVSVVGSYVAYDHSINTLQIIGLAVFFAALLFQCVSGYVSEMLPERQPLVRKPNEAERDAPRAGRDIDQAVLPEGAPSRMNFRSCACCNPACSP